MVHNSTLHACSKLATTLTSSESCAFTHLGDKVAHGAQDGCWARRTGGIHWHSECMPLNYHLRRVQRLKGKSGQKYGAQAAVAMA